MKVKIEDFLLAMGDYCREHSPEECASCKMSVDHEDPGDGTVFYGCAMFGCEYPKYAKMVKKRNFEVHERKEEGEMNREILFRAKKVDGGEWVEGYVVQRYGAWFIYDIKNADTCRQNGYLVDSDTICQYTGLTDKKGRKIWENDIIKYHYGDYYAPVKFGEYQSCFDSTTTCHVGFYVDWDEKRDFRKDLGYWIKMVDAEVVGNIHDKSEQQKDQRSTIICRDFMKKGRE